MKLFDTTRMKERANLIKSYQEKSEESGGSYVNYELIYSLRPEEKDLKDKNYSNWIKIENKFPKTIKKGTAITTASYLSFEAAQEFFILKNILDKKIKYPRTIAQTGPGRFVAEAEEDIEITLEDEKMLYLLKKYVILDF